jgi:NAD(P)H-dependent FMN reductase
MNDKLSIPLILGTNRAGRQSEHAAKFVLNKMEAHPTISPKLFDARNFDFPTNDYGQALKDKFPEYRDAIIGADGLVIVAPEYNHGYPGILKSIMDLVLREYVHKAVGLVGVSHGPFGGTRVIEQLVSMVRELGLAATFSDLNFSSVSKAFSENGKLLDDNFNRRADGFLEELVWMAKTLKWGRENVPSKFDGS